MLWIIVGIVLLAILYWLVREMYRMIFVRPKQRRYVRTRKW